MTKNETLLSIGDVSRFLNVPTHTIRYWEKEFKEYLNPGRTVGHQRRYTDDHLKKIRDIMRLLKNEGYSIAGAKKILELKHKSAMAVTAEAQAAPEQVAQRILDMIREQLQIVPSLSEEKSAVAASLL
jgi:DNA-binding transcriptional MerR regulator